MKTRYLVYTTIVWVLILFSSCCRKSSETARYFLTDEEKSFIPYTKGQTLTFMHSQGHKFNIDVLVSDTNMMRSLVEHCNEDYVVYEYIFSEMFSADPLLYVNMTINPKNISEYLDIQVNNERFWLSTTNNPDYDTLSIGNTVFTDVYKIENSFQDTTVIKPRSILYNKKYGLLQIKLTNNETFDYVK